VKQWKLRTAKTGVLALAVLAVAIAAGFGYRAYRQQLGAAVLAIQSPNGIQEGTYVKIGGIDQWIEIRGEDRGNPVILFVHGGPGGSTLPISSGWRPWEKSFTVVQWDQRGAGRTFRVSGSSIAATMTLAQMTQDGIEVAEYLRTHLGKDRIVLVGHSWGSFLGIHIVKQRPDLFYAFVGTGQLIGKQSFEKQFELAVTRLKALAQAANNVEASKELASVSVSPDFSKTPCDYVRFTSTAYSTAECDIVRKWAKALSLPSIADFELRGPVLPLFMPDFSLLDWYYWWRGMSFSATQLRRRSGPMIQSDLGSLGFDFSIPLFFFEGTDDLMTPVEPAHAYFEQIKAPQKQFVLFEGGDHFVPFDRPDEFLAQLIERVRPLALSTPNIR
jgi:pimeloyl-ACP methyl ester carboxylesterase